MRRRRRSWDNREKRNSDESTTATLNGSKNCLSPIKQICRDALPRQGFLQPLSATALPWQTSDPKQTATDYRIYKRE
jgi:hypothetical protein